MKVQNINNQQSFKGQLVLITVDKIFKKAHTQVITTTPHQDRFVRMISDQVTQRINIDAPKPVEIDDERAARFIKAIERITGFDLETDSRQRKFMINKDDSVVFLDQFTSEQGGALVKFKF